ncbi:MAG: hypothetical protein ACKOEO_25490 [Planctomycetaceae bacterium]
MIILARCLEVLHAFAEALDILRDYRGTKTAKVCVSHAAGCGSAATEAPRGLIYQRYGINADGQVVSAKIMPPTSQNQRQIELDLMQWLPPLLHLPDQQIADACEKLIRTWDPCISCSTHFLKLNIDRQNSKRQFQTSLSPDWEVLTVMIRPDGSPLITSTKCSRNTPRHSPTSWPGSSAPRLSCSRSSMNTSMC